eukprot:scaffold89644_cov32-Tisochrysis_lutea.AAC.4
MALEWQELLCAAKSAPASFSSDPALIVLARALSMKSFAVGPCIRPFIRLSRRKSCARPG